MKSVKYFVKYDIFKLCSSSINYDSFHKKLNNAFMVFLEENTDLF